LPFAVHAQYFNPGQDPASVRWNQVKSEHFKIIYPRGLDSQAVYIANAFEYFRGPGSASMGVRTSKWPVVLHNRTVNSNGFTPYAPKRIEMVTTPPQDNEDTYAQNWLDQLVIHEFRHSVQYAAVNRGFTKGLGFLIGQQALPAILGLFVPWWFIEGDAVVTETANSNTGRGRVPAYEMKLRAQFLEKGIYSYDKAVNGSYKDFIPNHYELGYHLVGQTRKEFGREVYSNVMRKTGNIPLMLVPFSNTLYKETGFGKSRLYDHITGNLRSDWNEADQAIDPTPLDRISSPGDKFYTSRIQPAVLGDGRIVALRTSIDDIPRIVIIDTTGNEQVLINPGPMTDGNLHAAGNNLVWSELTYDPRWNYRTYSVIRVYDTETGENRQLTHRTRYFSPSLSPDGKRIVTVQVTEDNRYSLVILDVETGNILAGYPTPGNYFPDHPAWSLDGKGIAVVLTRSEGKCLAVADAATGDYETLLPFSNTEISKPCFSTDYIYFTGAYTGTDNLFAFDLKTKEVHQVTSSRFGATDAIASPDGKRLYFSEYSANGYAIAMTEADPSGLKTIDPLVPHNWELADHLAGQENFIFNSADVPDSAYTVKPYRKGLNLFNFHSWAPLYVDLDNTEDVYPGIMLMSQNLLGTSTAIAGFSYDPNEETGRYYLKYSYEGYYPVFDLSADYGLRRGVHNDTADSAKISYRYNELNLSTGLRVPLNWNIRSWFVGAQPYAGYTLTFLKMVPGSELEFTRDRVNSLDYRLVLYAQSRQSEKDLQPRWGQFAELNYRHTPFDPDPKNSIFAAEGWFYLPGIAKHQGIRIYAGYQDRDQYYSTYSGMLTIPRGYSGIYADRAFSGSVGYMAPLFYPDWNAGPVFYLKRIKAAAYYDYMVSYDYSPNNTFQSISLDLTADFHLFRLFVPLELGLRTSYLPEEQDVVFQLLYSVNIGDLY
jgi:hypothetical protein